jgi:hypothetical protein
MSAKLNQPCRILRNYRHKTASKFHAANQRIRKGLTDNPNIPESTFSLGNPTLLPSYFSTSEKHDEVYHRAIYGSRLDIAERDLLQAQTTDYLDEIASILEAAAYRNPNMLLTSGFDLGKERRSHPRAKVPSAASEDFKPSNAE